MRGQRDVAHGSRAGAVLVQQRGDSSDEELGRLVGTAHGTRTLKPSSGGGAPTRRVPSTPAGPADTDTAAAQAGDTAAAQAGDTAGQAGDTGGLLRQLGFWDGTALVVGLMIGSGIFASSGALLTEVGSPAFSLVMWAVSGAIVVVCALCYAELGTCIPDAGAEAAYLRAAFGEYWSFAFTWTNVWVLKSGSQAIISLIFARYLGGAVLGSEAPGSHLDNDWRIRLMAIVCGVGFNAINCLGVRSGSTVNNVLTVTKLVAVAMVIMLAVVHLGSGAAAGSGTGDGTPSAASDNLTGSSAWRGTNVAAFAGAFTKGLWSFDGWSNANYVVEELRQPRQLPRVITTGVLFVTVVYLLMNIAYLAVLPATVVKTSEAIAIEFTTAVTGVTWPGKIMALLVAVSAAGACNASALSGARVSYSAARRQGFPAVFGLMNRRGAPWGAHAVQGTWVAVLLLVPVTDFGALVTYFGFAAFFFYGMSAVGLIMLRRSQPTLARPFRVPLYPATPVAAALLSLMVVVGAVVDAPAPSLAALAFIGLSFPVFHWVYRHRVEAYNAATASTTLAGAGAVTAAGAAQHGSQEVELRATAYVRAPAATST